MPIVKRSKRVPSEHLAAFLEDFFAGTTLNAEGNVQFQMWDFNHMFEILPDAYEFSSTLTPRQVQGVLSRALLNCRKTNKKTEDALTKEAEKLAKRKVAQKPTRYHLWVKFRARNMGSNAGFKLKWDGVRIRAAWALPAYLKVNEYFLSGHGDIMPNEPNFFGHIVLSCDARDEETAVERMLGALHVFHGLFNICASWGQYTHHSGLHWTDGPLWLGPFQFAFRGKTFLGNDRLWYNPDYLIAAWNRNPLDMKKVLSFMPRVKKLLKALEKHPLRDLIVKTVTIFQDGFASRDTSHRLLRYWSALEQLYSDDPNRNQQLIIKRASFAEGSPALERWRLNHAARMRNEHVHAGEAAAEADATTEHLRHLLSRHINHLILRRGDLKNHAEWLELVDLPTTASMLKARKAVIDKRLEYCT
jgi:hypothetical protein